MNWHDVVHVSCYSDLKKEKKKRKKDYRVYAHADYNKNLENTKSLHLTEANGMIAKRLSKPPTTNMFLRLCYCYC